MICRTTILTNLPIILALSIVLDCKGQKKQDLNFFKSAPSRNFTPAEITERKNDNTDIKNFTEFYIPSAILEAGIEPGKRSALNLGFGDDKVKFKYGFYFNKEDSGNLATSMGFSISAKAPDGARNLFKFDKTAKDFNCGIVFTKVLVHRSSIVKSTIGDEHVRDEEAFWLNFNLDLGYSKAYIFSDDITYSKIANNNFSFIVNLNHYYNGWYSNKSKCKRNVWNLGIGITHFDNYDDLDAISLRAGTYYLNTGFSEHEDESISGKIGPLDRNFGMILKGSFFHPITSPESPTSIMLGVNLNSFGLGSNTSRFNGNSGFYISKRSYDDDNNLKDDFSFGILGDFDNLNKWKETGSFKKNFAVIIVAQIPIRFK